MRSFVRLHKRLSSADTGHVQIRAALLAIAIGGLVAAAKTGAATLTGSASMLADAVQAWIGMFAEILMFAAYRVAQRPPDSEHPIGHGRESYVWSMLASIGMFIVGAQVGIWRGLIRLNAVDAPMDYRIGYVVLLASFVLQAISLKQALSYISRRAAERHHGVWEHVLGTSDAQLRTVFADDLIALIGLGIAGIGMALHQLTGDVMFDAAGSILIGILMAIAGVLMINVNRRFLAGATASPAQRALALELLKKFPEIERVTMLYILYVGPDQVLLVARVAIAGNLDQTALARTLRRIEQRIMERKMVVRASLELALPEERALA